MGAEHLEGGAELIGGCYRRLIDRQFLTESPGDGMRLELTPAGQKHLASNRFFLEQGQAPGLEIGTGSIVRIAFSLLVRWAVFLGLYWLATAYLLPLLPAIPLWDSIDRYVLSVRGLSYTLFDLFHLAAGFLLVTQAAVRLSLIYQRHRSIRQRAAKKYATLQTGGFYARVRHPMAANRLLYVLGLCFALPTVWALLPFAVLALLTILSGIIDERRELIPRFGTEYETYKRKVPRRYLTPWLAAYLGIAAVAFAAGAVL
jgi:protein-S-isoprenylcysteine O-methyltransferase Ste14